MPALFETAAKPDKYVLFAVGEEEDEIEANLDELALLVDQSELERRRADFTPKQHKLASPLLRCYAAQVSNASTEAVLQG